MKKILALLLAGVLCFALCACGGSSDNDVAEILENVVAIDSLYFWEEAENNIVKTKEIYNNKPVLFKEQIKEINDEYIIVGVSNTVIKVYLEKEDILNLNTNQYITVAGVVTDIELAVDGIWPTVSMNMENGYIVQNPETDSEPLYNNAKKSIEEGRCVSAYIILTHLGDYLESKELLKETVSKLAYADEQGSKWWKGVFNSSMPQPLTNEEIEEIIVGKWCSSSKITADAYTVYDEDGKYTFGTNSVVDTYWFVENNRLVRESKYTRSEHIIYHLSGNAYVFCAPKAYNKVTDDVYEIEFLMESAE